jgi:hypothetical protein
VTICAPSYLAGRSRGVMSEVDPIVWTNFGWPIDGQYRSAVEPEFASVDDFSGSVQLAELEGTVAGVESNGGGRNRSRGSLLH